MKPVTLEVKLAGHKKVDLETMLTKYLLSLGQSRTVVTASVAQMVRI